MGVKQVRGLASSTSQEQHAAAHRPEKAMDSRRGQRQTREATQARLLPGRRTRALPPKVSSGGIMEPGDPVVRPEHFRSRALRH